MICAGEERQSRRRRCSRGDTGRKKLQPSLSHTCLHWGQFLSTNSEIETVEDISNWQLCKGVQQAARTGISDLVD
jgi:hypothetical protein